MRPWLILPALALALPSTAGAHVTDGGAVEICHVGQHHGDEMAARTGQVWDVLYTSRGKYGLVSRAVRVDSCFDAVVDERGRETGKCVTVDVDGTPLLLVRGVHPRHSRPITVPTATWGLPGASRGGGPTPDSPVGSYVKPGERLRIRLGAQAYELAATGRYDPTRPPYDVLVHDYRLTLTRLSDGRQQSIPAPERFVEDGVPTLIWAGDLDRDGRLDLYMDLTNDYNVRDYTLFLSSRARKGRLVTKVASCRLTGC